MGDRVLRVLALFVGLTETLARVFLRGPIISMLEGIQLTWRIMVLSK